MASHSSSPASQSVSTTVLSDHAPFTLSDTLRRALGNAATNRLTRRYANLNDLMNAVHDQGVHSTDRDVVKLAKALQLARALMHVRLQRNDLLDSPKVVREYLATYLTNRPYEAFFVLYLDNQNRLLGPVEAFRGTLSQTAVYPREIMRDTIRFNAGAVIFAHNHPSGLAEPSHADRLLTDALGAALKHVDVRVLDRLIIADDQYYSFAEHGLI